MSKETGITQKKAPTKKGSEKAKKTDEDDGYVSSYP